MDALAKAVRTGLLLGLLLVTTMIGLGLATVGLVILLSEQFSPAIAYGSAAALWLIVPPLVVWIMRSSSPAPVQQAPIPEKRRSVGVGSVLVALSAGIAFSQGRTKDAATLFQELDPR